MELFTFGCSNTYGIHIPDREHNNWPYYLGQHMKATAVHNHGSIGASNERILRLLLSTDLHEDAFVVIMWTYPARAERVTDDGEFRSMNILHDNKSTQMYYRYIHTDAYDQWRAYNNMHHAQCFLEANGVPYFMTACNSTDYDYNNGGYLTDNLNKSRIMNDPDMNVVMCGHHYGRVPEDGHSNGDAHRVLANGMYDWLVSKQLWEAN